jgi:hypothetical protein
VSMLGYRRIPVSMLGFCWIPMSLLGVHRIPANTSFLGPQEVRSCEVKGGQVVQVERSGVLWLKFCCLCFDKRFLVRCEVDWGGKVGSEKA